MNILDITRRCIRWTFVLLCCSCAAAISPDSRAEEKVNRQSAPEAAQELRPEGTAWRDIVGNAFVEKTGFTVDFDFDSGISQNNRSDSSQQGGGGTANFPVASPLDKGFELTDLNISMRRDLKANIVPRVTPLPFPMSKKFQWGSEVDISYGRESQPCLMSGWDRHWGVNEPGATNSALAAANRQSFFCTSFADASIYLPIFRGVTITGGRYGSGLGNEVPPIPSNGPNFFFSHTYAMTSETWQVLGVLVSANVFHNLKQGYLLAEFGLNNGEQTAIAPSGDSMQSIDAALRWSSPKMTTSIAYSVRAGNGNVKTNSQGVPVNSTDFGVLYHVYSPTGQMRQRHNIVVKHEFNHHWNMEAEGIYFKQDGDKKATTVLEWPWGGPSFSGAHAVGFNGRAIYKFNQKYAAGLRLETFNDPTGFWLVPMDIYLVNGVPTHSKGRFNDFTAGLNYFPVKFIKIAPEVRFDWSNNPAYGANNSNVASGLAKPSKSMVMFNIETAFRF